MKLKKLSLWVSNRKTYNRIGNVIKMEPVLSCPRRLCCTADAIWSATGINVLSSATCTRRFRSHMTNSVVTFPCKRISCEATAVLKIVPHLVWVSIPNANICVGAVCLLPLSSSTHYALLIPHMLYVVVAPCLHYIHTIPARTAFFASHCTQPSASGLLRVAISVPGIP